MESKILYSQTLLHQAILLLLQKKSIEKITVQELCKTAGVNRTTFYNHYERPEDILREIVQQFLSSFSENHVTLDSESAINFVTHLLELMETNRYLSQQLLHALPGTYLSECTLSLPIVQAQLHAFTSSSAESSAITSFAIAGSVSLITEWILKDSHCSAREEAELILKLCRQLYI